MLEILLGLVIAYIIGCGALDDLKDSF